MYSDCDDDFSYDDDLECYSAEEPDFSVKGSEKQFNIVAASDIIQEMNKYIDKVNEIFRIKRSLIKRLLVHFRWNPERLLDRYYESSDSCESLFREAGIVHLESTEQNNFERQTSQQFSRGWCNICCTPNVELTGLLCDHHFCVDCWGNYFQTMIMDKCMAENILCMATYCDTIATESFVLATLPDKKVKSRYYQLIAQSYVSNNKMFKWCPRPGCENSAEVFSLDVKHITCTCGMEWCFGCGRPDHVPLESCSILKKWLVKAADESENNKWMVINTKECPKCAAAIEKNGGCNHMVCTNRSCSFEFCWICLGDWKPHGSNWYSCNKYIEDREHTAKLTKERKAMERYHHYYDRYWNHKKSCEFEQGGMATHISTKLEYIQTALKVPWIEAQFLKEALAVLLKCRTMLQYSYVFAFYVERSPETEIFEQNQRDLEHNTELLSGLLEDHNLPKCEQDLVDTKMKVNDRAAYCDTRRILLLKDVQDGYDKGVWKYRDV